MESYMKEIAFLESNRDGKGGTANQQTRKTRDGGENKFGDGTL